MNRTFLTVSGVSSALSPLLVESAVKGTALLVLAAIAATILRRDSAATRHLVWLIAMDAMLVVPVLSAMLPQWRVLPLYWFNPLVWFAAWRLGVERERACDDLVLASGVRPSAYAGHLLEVVSQLSPARLTQSCGLAMARQSSLEGRLVAVLSCGRNRRRVTRILAVAAVAVAVAIPLAILRMHRA